MPAMKSSKLRKNELAYELNMLDAIQDGQGPLGSAKTDKTAAQKAKRGRPRRATVEDGCDSDYHQVLTLRRPLKNRRVSEATIDAVTNLLDDAAAVLARLRNADLPNDWIDELSLENKKKIQQLQDVCQNLSLLLSVKSQQTVASQETEALGPHSGISINEFYFLMRKGKVVKFCAPVAEFKGGSRFTERKTVGGVRVKGTFNPIKFTFSGWKEAAHDHPMLVDTEGLMDLITRFADFYNRSFPKSRFDHPHNVPDGYGRAGHCEPKLLVWFGCNLVLELMGRESNNPIGEFWRLNQLKKKLEIELILSQAPCTSCKNFINLFENITGIKTTCILAPVCGELHQQKDKNGQKGFPTGSKALFKGWSEEESSDIDQFKSPSQRNRTLTTPASRKAGLKKIELDGFRYTGSHSSKLPKASATNTKAVVEIFHKTVQMSSSPSESSDDEEEQEEEFTPTRKRSKSDHSQYTHRVRKLYQSQLGEHARPIPASSHVSPSSSLVQLRRSTPLTNRRTRMSAPMTPEESPTNNKFDWDKDIKRQRADRRRMEKSARAANLREEIARMI